MGKMKVACITACFMILLLFSSCQTKGETETETADSRTVTFVNDVQDADVWILPQTQENLKTTLWGTATISKVKTGESRVSPLCQPGEDGLYLFRMIDTDRFYYSVNGVVLKADWTMQIKGETPRSVTLEVTDEHGVLNSTYEVFAARL